MPAFVSLVLAAVVLTFLIRLVFVRVRAATEALEGRRLVLIERRQGLSHFLGFDRLQVAANAVVAENQQRARAEKDSLNQIEATLGKLRDAVLILDPKEEVVLANEAFRRLLGVRGSPLGRPITSLIAGAGFQDYISAVRGRGGDPQFILEVPVAGEKRYFEVTGTILPEAEGAEEGLTLFVLHDVTRQKRLEQVRTEFVANVSHELRTPVTIIKGFADTLMDDWAELSDDDSQRFVQKIQRNATRLHQMLEELLLLSRLEANPDAVSRSPESLGRLVQEVVENFRSRVDHDGRSIVLERAEGIDTVLVDRFRISRVVENLLENAVRHGRGWTRITVRTRIEGGAVTCDVSDDGEGIPPADLPHIFERFYRVDKGRSRESGGTGLGLSIVKHIIQHHGGNVEAESVPGQGTTIRFTLPLPGSGTQ